MTVLSAQIESTCRFGVTEIRSKFGRCRCPDCKNHRNAQWIGRLNEDPESREKRRAGYRDRHAHDPISKMLMAAKYRAKKFNVPFSIGRTDVSIPAHCPALGIALAVGKGKICDGSPSLERIRPELGYVKGNVVVLSHLANRIKNSATLEQMIAVAAWARKTLEGE